jgi:hypothetical protein
VERSHALALGLCCALALVGCAGGTGGAPDSPTGTATAAPPPATVTYVVRAGPVPAEFASLTLRPRAVFVTDAADLGPCYPAAYGGPYEPTITPLPTPAGDRVRTRSYEVVVTDLDGPRTLTVEAPASARGHALLAAEARATHRNGSTVGEIRGATTTELAEFEGRPVDGARHGVTVRVDAHDDRRYDYRSDGS